MKGAEAFARIVHCPTPGAYAARNAGIREATGDILAFTDVDCVPAPDWVREGVDAIQRCKGRSVIGGEVRFLQTERQTAVERYQRLTGFMQEENINNAGFATTANVFVTRATLAQIGLFDERLFSAGDLEWSRRAARLGHAVMFSPSAVVYTLPRSSLMAAIRQARRVAGGRFALRRLRLSHVSPEAVGPRRSGISSVKYILADNHLTVLDKARVLSVAVILKIVRALELARLSLGQMAERR